MKKRNPALSASRVSFSHLQSHPMTSFTTHKLGATFQALFDVKSSALVRELCRFGGDGVSMKRTKLLVGITAFWLGLALLMDGLNGIVLPIQLLHLGGTQPAATTLGLLTFAGLLAALVIQPIAGEWSDRMRGTWGRTGGIAVALLGILAGLFALGLGQNLVSLFVAYLVIQLAASIGRGSMAEFIPHLLPYDKTGRADAMQEGNAVGRVCAWIRGAGQFSGRGSRQLRANGHRCGPDRGVPG